MFEALALLIMAWIGFNVIRSLILRIKNGGAAHGTNRGDGGGDTGSGVSSGQGWTSDTSYNDCDSDSGGGGSDSGGGDGGSD